MAFMTCCCKGCPWSPTDEIGMTGVIATAVERERNVNFGLHKDPLVKLFNVPLLPHC